MHLPRADMKTYLFNYWYKIYLRTETLSEHAVECITLYSVKRKRSGSNWIPRTAIIRNWRIKAVCRTVWNGCFVQTSRYYPLRILPLWTCVSMVPSKRKRTILRDLHENICYYSALTCLVIICRLGRWNKKSRHKWPKRWNTFSIKLKVQTGSLPMLEGNL